MKATERFTRVIAEYLNQRAMSDPLFAPNLQKPNKSIDECVTYILNQVKASGCHGFEDAEIYSMAVHYYDEDELEIGNPLSCQVVINHQVQLTEEEKEEAKEKALKQYKDEQLRDLERAAEKRKARLAKKAETESAVQQPLLFDI